MTQEDFGYYQLKELIRDEMREQSPDLAKIMAKYKAITSDKDAEIAALQMQIRVEGAANGKELAALKAEIEWLRTGIQEAIDESDKEIGDGDTIAEIFNELARFLADDPPQPREEAEPADLPHVGILCDEDGCEQPAVGRYGGGEYCQYHLDENNNYFDENYR